MAALRGVTLKSYSRSCGLPTPKAFGTRVPLYHAFRGHTALPVGRAARPRSIPSEGKEEGTTGCGDDSSGSGGRKPFEFDDSVGLKLDVEGEAPK